MYIPLNWIKEYTDVNIPNEQLIDEVSTKIGSVEEVIDLAKKYEGITIAKIVKTDPHPDADKLGVYQLDIGGGKTVQVVAGDKTLEVGNMVAYFAPGVKVPYNAHPEKYDGIVTKVSLRGVESEGMMASERELDLGSNHNHVMRLDENVKAGDSLAQVYNLNDLILDVENKALANRGDLFGIIGIARELSGIQSIPFKSPDWLHTKANTKESNEIEIGITNEVETFCKRYMAVALKDIKVSSSPTWLKVQLSKVGIRPINNVVDITNYMMYLTSQPLHAFDLDKVLALSGKDKPEILVRLAKRDETITTLDGKTITLDDNTMVITDGQHPIAIAGIMGGQSTEVDENTTRVIIESASFDRYNVRKTSMRLGLFTEAVTRFTKAIDPNFCESTLQKTIDMLKKLASGVVMSNIYDSYAQPVEPRIINLNISKLNTILGTSLELDAIKGYLENIEYGVEVTEDTIQVTVPTFRQDVQIAEDIYEDIGRHYGYNNIPVTLPTRSTAPNKVNSMLEFKDRLRDIVTKIGGNELLTYNFTDAKTFEKYNIDFSEAYKIINPLSPELEYMRFELLPSLLDKASYNIDQGFSNFILYEINKGHSKNDSDQDKTENLPIEREYLGLVTLNTEYKGSSYYSSKAVLEKILTKLNVKTYDLILLKDADMSKVRWIERVGTMLNPNKSAILVINEEYVGILGELSASSLLKSKLPNTISVLELDLNTLQGYTKDSYGYIEPSRYPKTAQDFCFEVPTEIRYKDLYNIVERTITDVNYTYEISPLDIYMKEGSDTKRITFRLVLQHRDRTLTQYDITQLRNTLDKEVESVGGRVV